MTILYEIPKEELQHLLDTSNGYSDVLIKLGLNPKGGNPDTLKKVIAVHNLNQDKLNKNRNNLFKKLGKQLSTNQKLDINSILIKNSTYKGSSQQLLKKLYDSNLKVPQCECCKIVNWNGKDITFQLHHKDGEHSNNELENLEVLCPNCHSQTDNFAGKNKKQSGKLKNIQKTICPICGINEMLVTSKRCTECGHKSTRKCNRPSKEELQSLIDTYSFTAIGKKFNVSDNAVRKWCKKYGLI